MSEGRVLALPTEVGGIRAAVIMEGVRGIKAAVLEDTGRVGVRDVPYPQAEPGTVLVAVLAAGICGSDLHGWASGMYEPGLIMGHELAGRIVSIGPDVAGFAEGDLVTANPILPCRRCRFCREGRANLCDEMGHVGITEPGAFAELIRLPAANLFHLGDLPASVGALAEPLAAVLHAYRKSGAVGCDRVLIIGGGPIGNLLARVLALHGIKQTILSEPNDFRREQAAPYAGAVFDPRTTDAVDFCRSRWGDQPDVVFECVGLPQTIREAIYAVVKGGRVVVVGVCTEPVEVDFLSLMYNEKSLQAVFSYSDEFAAAVELLAAGKIVPDDLITSQIPLAEISGHGFEKLAGQNRELKVLVRPHW